MRAISIGYLCATCAWSEDSVIHFQDALTSESIRSKIDNFLNSGVLVISDNINLAFAELASIFTEAADMSLKKRGNQNKKPIRIGSILI
jgi:hypothetical protein